MDSYLKDELNVLNKGQIVLLKLKAEDVFETNVFVAKTLEDKGMKGLIITGTRPYLSLKTRYNEENIKNVHYFDLVSKMYNPELSDNDEVTYLSSISDLIYFSVKLNKILEKNFDYILFDSIDSMLIHNDDETLVRFMHNLFTELRLKQILGIFIMVDDDSHEERKKEFLLLADKIIAP